MHKNEHSQVCSAICKQSKAKPIAQRFVDDNRQNKQSSPGNVCDAFFVSARPVTDKKEYLTTNFIECFDILCCDVCLGKCDLLFDFYSIVCNRQYRILMFNMNSVYLLLPFCCHLSMRFNTIYKLNKQHNRHGNEFGLGWVN